MVMTKEDVVAAYKIFLNRLPESMEVVNTRVGQNSELNLIDFVLSDEFLKRPEASEIMTKAAKIVLADDANSGPKAIN